MPSTRASGQLGQSDGQTPDEQAEPHTRVAFAEKLTAHPSTLWISNEGPGVIESLSTILCPSASASSIAYFVVGVGGVDAALGARAVSGW